MKPKTNWLGWAAVIVPSLGIIGYMVSYSADLLSVPSKLKSTQGQVEVLQGKVDDVGHVLESHGYALSNLNVSANELKTQRNADHDILLEIRGALRSKNHGTNE